MEQSDEEKLVEQFITYEDYLDSLITKDDLLYLEDKEMCRELLTLIPGYHSSRRVISKALFEETKAKRAAKIEQNKVKELKLCSSGKTCSDSLMQALAKRERDNLTGCVATIIFLRDVNEKNEEVSAYIDFSHRLKSEDWESYFKEEKKLTPLMTDLSFYNWSKEMSFHTSSPCFDVIIDVDSTKLKFICKSDGSTIDVEPKAKCAENTYRLDITGTKYHQAVIFDHVVDVPICLIP